MQNSVRLLGKLKRSSSSSPTGEEVKEEKKRVLKSLFWATAGLTMENSGHLLGETKLGGGGGGEKVARTAVVVGCCGGSDEVLAAPAAKQPEPWLQGSRRGGALTSKKEGREG